jgi:hypothetical protein
MSRGMCVRTSELHSHLMRAAANCVHTPLQVPRTAGEVRGSLQERLEPMRPQDFRKGQLRNADSHSSHYTPSILRR